MNIFTQFKEFLIKENLFFVEQFGKHPLVTMKIEGNNGLLFVTVHFVEEKNSLVAFSDFPVRIPQDKRRKIYEFINVLNEQSLISNFILSGDGYLRVKSSLYSCEKIIEKDSFRRFLFINFNSLDNHFTKILCLSEIKYSTATQINLN